MVQESYVETEDYTSSRLNPSSFSYSPPTTDDGSFLIEDRLKAVNMVVICNSPDEQMTLKAALSKACSQASSPTVVWDYKLIPGVYQYMDGWSKVSAYFHLKSIAIPYLYMIIF